MIHHSITHSLELQTDVWNVLLQTCVSSFQPQQHVTFQNVTSRLSFVTKKESWNMYVNARLVLIHFILFLHWYEWFCLCANTLSFYCKSNLPFQKTFFVHNWRMVFLKFSLLSNPDVVQTVKYLTTNTLRTEFISMIFIGMNELRIIFAVKGIGQILAHWLLPFHRDKMCFQFPNMFLLF